MSLEYVLRCGGCIVVTTSTSNITSAIDTLIADGWHRSVLPNTYIPKPLSVWIRDWDVRYALVHRGRVDLSGDEVVLGSDVLRAFADLADAPAEAGALTESKVPVRFLVWYRQPGIECLSWDGDIGWAVRWSDPVELLAGSCAPSGKGLWIWEGTATVLSGSTSEPDTISLDGAWRRPTDLEADALAVGGNIFSEERP